MRLCSLFSPFDCGLCLNCEAGNHASFLVPNGHFGGPLASNIPIFIVPLVGCRQAGNHIDPDTLMGIRGQVLNLLLLVEVADSHVSERRMTPMLCRFDWHRMGELFQAHTFAVVPSNQVFPVELVLASLRVVYDNSGLFGKVVGQHFGQIPACMVVVVSGNPRQRHPVGMVECPVNCVFQHTEALAEYLGRPVVGGIDDRTFGRGFRGEVVEVQEIVPDRDHDFFDDIGGDLLDHPFNGVLVILRRNGEIVVVRACLSAPAELAEVAIIQGELDQVGSVFGLPVPGLGGDRHLGDQTFDSLLDRLGSLAAELDGDLQVGDLPEGFDTVFADYLFSFSGDFPTVDFVFGDFPNVAIHFGMVEEFLDRPDLVSIVGQSPAVIAQGGFKLSRLLRLACFFFGLFLQILHN